MNKEYVQYYTKGKTGDARYNYDLLPLITDFSFYDFCMEAKDDEHGAFLVITNKQYIIGYNRGFGEGTHSASFARVMKDIHGGGEIKNENEVIRLDTMLDRTSIEARIIYELYQDSETHQVQRQGYLHFDMGYHRMPRFVSYSQYEQFLKFYEKYNDEIKQVCKKFNFVVNYYTYDENGIGTHHPSTSLEEIRDYMSKHLIDDVVDEDEIILNSGMTK